jgi:structure-specific recognition protein 1
MQFSREEEMTAELNMSQCVSCPPLPFTYLPRNREEVEKYEKLKKNYDDPTFEVVSSVFRALAGRKIIGSGAFQSYVGVWIIP